MGEGLEILLWLGLMAVLAIRGAVRNRQRAERGAADESEPLAGGPAPDRLAGEGGRAASTPGRAGGAPRGLLERMMDYASELEREARAQQAEVGARQARAAAGGARPATRAEARRGGEPWSGRGEDRDRTVVVPGRRVRPSLPAERTSAPPAVPAPGEALEGRLEVLDVAESDASRRPRRFEASRLQAGGPLPRSRRPMGETAEEPVRRPRRPGLERLDRFPPLKRAIVLSEILGRPPGLEGVAPVERQWWRD